MSLESPRAAVAVPDSRRETPASKPPVAKAKSVVREYGEALAVALILAIIIRSFVVQAFKIPSGSMIPTLAIGDHILVNKFVYGVRIPYLRTELFPVTSPKRGDVVVFIYPQDEEKDFIKRVVGVAGDVVEVRDKRLFVNGEAAPDPDAHFDEHDRSVAPRDNFGPFTVPAGKIFVMGDNRDHSYDSRFWGPVDLDKVKGKAFLIYWSWDGGGRWVRWERDRTADLLTSPLRVGAFALAAYAGAVALILAARGGDVSSLITAGDVHVDRAAVPGAIRVMPRSTGYDGEFFYRLALDPLAEQQTNLGITLDRPAYRHRRILYPLFARWLALGQAEWIPTALVAVNGLAAGVLAAIGGALAMRLGRHPGWGLLFAFYPGFLLSLSRDLAEIVAAVFVLGGMLALSAKRENAAAVAWLFASLTRETTLVLPIAVLVARVLSLRGKGPPAPSWRVALVPLLGHLAWAAWVSLHWDQPATPGSSFAGLPLVGFAGGVAKLAVSSPFEWVWSGELVLVACFTVAVVRELARVGYAEIAWLGYALIGITAQARFWSEDWSFLRVLAEFYVIGVTLLLASPVGPPTAIFTLAVWMWLARLHQLRFDRY